MKSAKFNRSKTEAGSKRSHRSIASLAEKLKPVQNVPAVQWFDRLTMTGSVFRSS